MWAHGTLGILPGARRRRKASSRSGDLGVVLRKTSQGLFNDGCVTNEFVGFFHGVFQQSPDPNGF